MTRFTGLSRFFKKVFSIFLLLYLFFTPVAFSLAAEKSVPKRVLVIYSYHEGMPWERIIDVSLRATLKSKSTEPIALNVEHADRIRYPGDAYLKNFVDLLRYKYSHPKMEVVIGVDDEATDILLKYGEELFPGVPLVFVTAERKILRRDSLKPNMISLIWGADIQGTADLICKMLPKTRQIFVISGSALTDRAVQNMARRVLRGYTNRLEINYLAEVTQKDLMDKVEQLPERSVLLYLGFSRDSEGVTFVPREILSEISQKANAPTFGIVDTYLGFGIVGGHLLSAKVQGRRCSEIALQTLGGQSPTEIPPSKAPNQSMFDWRELKRWNIDERDLPEGSIVRYRELSFWDLYWRYVIGVILIIFLQGIIILSLFVSRQKNKKSEKMLLSSHERYRAFMENSIEGIWCAEFDEPIDTNLPVDEQFELVYKHCYIAEANDAYAQSVGLEKGRELIGARLDTFCPRSIPQNVATVKAWIQEQYSITNAESVESYKEGITRVLLNNSVAVIKSGHFVEKVWGTQIDITDRKNMEKELIQAEQKYRIVADFTYDWEYWEAPDGSLIYVSPSCERITGYSVVEFTERPELISEIIVPEDRMIWQTHKHDTILETERTKAQCEFRIHHKNGHIRWIAHICQPVYNENGDQNGVRASNRDITELMNIELKLRDHRDMITHLDRRANLGQLAGSIAHELTQPLTGIMSDAQAGELLLKKGKVDQTQIEEIFADIVSDTKRASQVLRNLRDLFGDQKYEFKPLNINVVIEETLLILHNELISQGVTINTDLSAKLPNVNANKVQLQQILINMIINSWQAMHQVAETDRWLSITTAFGDDGQVVVCLEDNGPGIDPAILEGIFEPMTTTKEAGLGMGLAISTTIVQAHGGRIWAENNPKGGTRFYFTLPIVEIIP